MTRTLKSALHRRPFATLRRPSTDDATTPAGGTRAEIRALVTRGTLNRRDGADLLARLRLKVLPYGWAVTVSVPITAPNGRYAAPAGIGQLVAAPGRLQACYLVQTGALTVPTDQPACRSLTGLTSHRTEACPGYPVGGIYQISADTTTAPYAGSTARLAAELDQLTGINAHASRMRYLGAHRVTGLADPADANSAGSPEPGTATPARRLARGAQQ